MARETGPAIGIDLGTEYASIGVFRNGKVEVIPGDQGRINVPSYVTFTGKERLIGDAAKEHLVVNHCNTVFGAKSLIGRKFQDRLIQSQLQYWPFHVLSDNEGDPIIHVQYNGTRKVFNPEEIMAMILSKLKDTAEEYLGNSVTDCVITVPAYYNFSQRHSIKEAGMIAGLNVVRVINESTAAGIAYTFQNLKEKERMDTAFIRKSKRSKIDKNILVYDLGASNAGVTIFTTNDNDGFVRVLSSAGECGVGGNDFDTTMVTHFVREFHRIHCRDITIDKRALCRVRIACERAKRILSSVKETTIVLDNLIPGIDFVSSITRHRFEDLNVHLFESCLGPIQKALGSAQLDKSQVQEVVLVGGSTQIPRIQELVKELFTEIDLSTLPCPDTAVVSGAAIQAAIMAANRSCEIFQENLLLVDILPFSLGIETIGGKMTTLLKRGCPIPFKQVQTFTSDELPVGNVMNIYAGERAFVMHNLYLGELRFNHQMLAGKDSIFEVSFDLDASSAITISVTETTSGQEGRFSVNEAWSKLRDARLVGMFNQATRFRRDDDQRKDTLSARNQLERYCVEMKRTLSGNAAKVAISEGDRNRIVRKCDETLTWLDSNRDAEKQKYEDKQNDLQVICRFVNATIASHSAKK